MSFELNFDFNFTVAAEINLHRKEGYSLVYTNGSLNSCHAEYIQMQCPLPIFSQSDDLIQVVDINSHTE